MVPSGAHKVAFVTGAGSGIGRATAGAFAAKGYGTVLADRDEAAGRQVESELRGQGDCAFIACDVADDASVAAALAKTAEYFGRLDAAFNAAGIEGDRERAAADCTLENWNRVLQVNLTGIFHCLRHQIPLMLKSGGGSIVNCASTAGIRGAPGFAAYTASKHGVVGLTRSAALDYARQGIRVNAVCPGMIDTPMNARLDRGLLRALLDASPLGRMGRPEEIAAAVLWLCDDQSGYVSGQVIPVDGAWTAK